MYFTHVPLNASREHHELIPLLPDVPSMTPSFFFPTDLMIYQPRLISPFFWMHAGFIVCSWLTVLYTCGINFTLSAVTFPHRLVCVKAVTFICFGFLSAGVLTCDLGVWVCLWDLLYLYVSGFLSLALFVSILANNQNLYFHVQWIIEEPSYQRCQRNTATIGWFLNISC